MTRRDFFILAVVILASRLPFLWTGYGSDPDAWRVANSGWQLWTTGIYEPSRWPGYPLYEILTGPLVIAGGAPLSNAATVLATLLLLGVFLQIADILRGRSALLVAGLAFCPLLWKNSAATTDYVWSLLALLLSFLSSLRQATVSSGIWAGIAAGFRPFSLLGALPIIVLMARRKSSGGEFLRFAAATGMTLIAAYALPLFTFGLPEWISATLAQSEAVRYGFADTFAYFGYRSLTAIGIPAAAAAGVILASRWTSVRSVMREGAPEPAALLAGVASFLFLFLLFPLEREYLLPAIPYGFLLLDRVATPRQMRWFMACVISLAFVNIDLVRHHGVRGTPELNIREGMILEDWSKRERILEVRSALGSISLEGKSVIMTGMEQQLWFENPLMQKEMSSFWRAFQHEAIRQVRNPETVLIEGLDKAELQAVRNAGYGVYCLASTRESVEAVSGYVMQEAQVEVLDY